VDFVVVPRFPFEMLSHIKGFRAGNALYWRRSRALLFGNLLDARRLFTQRFADQPI
jgi:hypothetical protein